MKITSLSGICKLHILITVIFILEEIMEKFWNIIEQVWIPGNNCLPYLKHLKASKLNKHHGLLFEEINSSNK